MQISLGTGATYGCLMLAVNLIAVMGAPAEVDGPDLAIEDPCDLGNFDVDLPLRAVVVGNFGHYEGGEASLLETNASEILAAIRSRHAGTGQTYDIGLTVGNNFNPRGVRTVEDQRRRWLPYSTLGVPFYATLGSRDHWVRRARTQLRYHSWKWNPEATGQDRRTWNMPCRHYSFTAGGVHFLALDTDEGALGWDSLRGAPSRSRRHRRRFFSERSFAAPPWSVSQTLWLKRKLEPRDSKWRVVYGYHSVFSRVPRLSAARLRRGNPSLLELLKSHDVTAYIGGNTQNLQHLQRAGLDVFLAGAGGGPVVRVDCGADATCRFAEGIHGFMEIVASTTELTLELIDKFGIPRHKVRCVLSGRCTVVSGSE